MWLCGFQLPTEDRSQKPRHRPSFVSLLLLMLLRFCVFFVFFFVFLYFICLSYPHFLLYYTYRHFSVFLFSSSCVPQSPPLRSFLTRNDKQHKTYNIEKEKKKKNKKKRSGSLRQRISSDDRRRYLVTPWLDMSCCFFLLLFLFLFIFSVISPLLKKK